MSKERMQVAAVERLLQQYVQASGFGFGEDFIVIPVAQVKVALDQGAMEFYGICPECVQGKHANCDDSALNDDDEIDICRCAVQGHDS